jgi:thiol-disulfide isomerase/thioredoxin
MSRRHAIAPSLVLAAALFTTGWSPLSAQETALRGFQTIGDYQLQVDTQPVPGARIFALRTPAAILVITSQFPAPVLLLPQSGGVQTVQLLKVAEMPDGSIDLLPGYLLADQGSFRVEGLDVHFTVGSKRGVLGPKPPLLGLSGLDDLRTHDPQYQRLEEAYEPSAPILAGLRQRTEEVRVRVFFGSWCPACGQMVPRVMRVAEALKGSNLTFEFYGLPRGFDGEPEASRYDIHSVPTGVVFVNGREVGRINGNGWKLPELAINNLLAGA